MSAPLARWGLRAFAMLCVVQGAVAQAQPTITRETSPAGLSFRYVHMPEDTHQSLGFSWKDGTSIALPGKEALSGLGPALMMEGPKGLTRSVMVEDLRDLQGTIGLTASVNYARGNVLAPAAKFSETAALMARVLADPALPENVLRDQQRNRAAALQQAAQNPETQARQLLARLLLGDGPYWRTIAGDAAALARITTADIQAWRREVLVRDNLMLVAVGPLSAADVGREIDRVFAGLPQSGSRPEVPKPVVRSPGKLVVLERPVVQTIISAAAPTSLAVTPDFVRAQVAITVLGGGFNGRMMKAVRERLGATYGISATLQAYDESARGLHIHTPVANDKAKDALATIRAEYAHFFTDGITDEEIAPIKTNLISGIREITRRGPPLAGFLLALMQQGFPDDYLATYDARVNALDRGTINATIRNNFPAPPLTIVMVAPSADGLGADCVIKAPAEIARCE
jgi:zinc protease